MAKMELYKKIGIGSMASLVFGILFGWVAFPNILNFMLAKEMSLAKGTEMRDMWIKIPFALDFKIYLFNCTNPEEVMVGGKPHLQEVGPYFYDEWKEKVNIVDIEEEDAIIYNRKDTFIFNKAKSQGLTGDELITTPHVVIISTVSTVTVEKPAMITLVGKALDGIYNNPKTIFFTAKASDILFNGVTIDCDRTEFAPKALCTAMKKVPSFDVLPNNQLKFSYFSKKNGTIDDKAYKVLRGKKNIMDVGKVIEYDGKKTQEIWNGPKCNDFDGTDSTIFAPFLTEKDDLRSFTAEICRSLPAWYERKSSYAGIPTNRYVSSMGDLANEPELHCFCDTPETCPKKGLMDLKNCTKAPLIATLPHFLYVDPIVQDSVKGLSPDVEKHGVEVDFEPISGSPLQARKRLQFNILVQKSEKIDLFKNFSDTLIPIMWLEEGIALDKDMIKMLEQQLFLVLRLVKVFKWLMVVIGLFGVMGAGLYKYKNRIINFAISPTPTTVRQGNGLTNAQKNLTISTIQSLQTPVSEKHQI